MIIKGNNKDRHKLFSAAADEDTAGVGVTTTKKPKRRLNPDAQRIILENATVNRIRGDIDYANALLLRSFRLSLRMEQC
jgi:hypothetical protein